ncbi:MAG: hypothetical protein AAGE94_11670 [Acidobacteriota bacterium]
MNEQEFSADDLWLRQPESEALRKDINIGSLCSCDNVCVAVVDDSLSS